MEVDGKKIYLATFETHVGEYGQIFHHAYYAKDVNELTVAVHNYLKDYYGKDSDGENNMTERDGDTYYYFNGECIVEYIGYVEITDIQHLVRQIYM